MNKSQNKEILKELDDDEVRNRLCLINPVLISQILTHATRFFEDSVTGRAHVDEKANWFLALDTACLTLFFTGVSVLLVQIKRPLLFPTIFIVLSIACIIALFISVIFLFCAIRARSDFRTLNDQDILDKDILEESDQPKQENTDWNANPYDRYIIANLIKISNQNYAINEKKGFYLKVAQTFFLIGLLLLAIVSLIVSFTLIDL